MAFRKIDIPEPEGFGEDFRGFVRFNAIGDKFAGVYVKTTKTTGNYGEQTNYVFRNREGTWGITPPTNLARGLGAAQLKPGYKVLIKFIGEKKMSGDKSALKLFEIQVDDEIKPSTGAPPAPKPPPPADEFDDLPF